MLPNPQASTPAINGIARITDILQQEANAISQTLSQLDPSAVQQALQLLQQCQGKILLLGIGKSGLIARKIAATLTSTGSPALYLHPADALHGDIGIATPNDVAIILSNSGETDELLGMLPYLKKRQIPIIAIIGNLQSTLARQATAILNASVEKEACPFNLAPTTSTTVALALGDAIAITLMQMKGLTPQDFAYNHPAGRLGKRLTLTVQDLMHQGEQNPILSPESGYLEILETLSHYALGAVSIIDRNGTLLGLITDGDIRRTLKSYRPDQWLSLTSAEIMTPHPISVTPDTLAYTALQLMENRPSQISVLPVVNSAQQVVGMLRLHDIVRSGLA